MLMDLIPPSKDTVWQTGLKRMMQQSIVTENYLIVRNKHWRKGKAERFSKPMACQNSQELQYLFQKK
jgi:hypothetical protein